MNQELRQLFIDWTGQVSSILSKVASSQPVSKEECDTLAEMQGELTEALEKPAPHES